MSEKRSLKKVGHLSQEHREARYLPVTTNTLGTEIFVLVLVLELESLLLATQLQARLRYRPGSTNPALRGLTRFPIEHEDEHEHDLVAYSMIWLRTLDAILGQTYVGVRSAGSGRLLFSS